MTAVCHSPMAAIDLGSNAVRLLVGKLNTQGGIVQYLFTRVPVALGRHCYESDGCIPTVARATLIDALNGLRLIARSMKVSHCRVVATAAVRDCKNRQVLQSEVFKQTGFQIETLSGEEEAAIVGAFVLRQFPDAAALLNVDAGGGSTDCVIIVHGRLVAAATFAVGTARPYGGAEAEKNNLAAWLRRHATARNIIAVASGGGARMLASICGGITESNLTKFIEVAEKMSLHKRAAAFNLILDRAQKIVPAAILCRHVLQTTGVAELKTIQGGLGEAVLTEMLAQPGKFGAPLA